jgi:hypothetical protein
MKELCNCKDWKELKRNKANIFRWDPTYGWVLSWIELSDETSFTQVHRYGVSINFCPMCGKHLKNP